MDTSINSLSSSLVRNLTLHCDPRMVTTLDVETWIGMGTLDMLKVDSCSIPTISVSALEGNLVQATKLELYSNSLRDEDGVLIVQAIPSLKIKSLTISDNFVKFQTLKMAASIAAHLVYLDLSSNMIGDVGLEDQNNVEFVGSKLQSLKLNELYSMNFNRLEIMLRSLKGSPLLKLEIGKLNIGDDGVQVLADTFATSQLQELYISDSQIGHPAFLLKIKSLRYLILNDKFMNEGGIDFFLDELIILKKKGKTNLQFVSIQGGKNAAINIKLSSIGIQYS